nr:MAG TPA: hypothetical protein [Caudoviricetes sp.]
MTVDEVLAEIVSYGEPTDGMQLYVRLALIWPVLDRIPADRRLSAAALFALHMRATRNVSGQLVSEREGDLARTYATTASSTPWDRSFWGRMLQDLIPDASIHLPSIIVSPYGRGCGCGDY